MIHGFIAGVTWALETVILGIAFGMTPFVTTEQAIFLAPFVSTFLHDACSSLYMLIYNLLRGNIKKILGVIRTPSFKWLVLSSAIGGPIGMTGYVMAVRYMGASVGAVASAVYPAIGTALACIFLREKVRWYRWIFLGLTLLCVYGLSSSPILVIENLWLGALGVLMCAFGWGTEAVILAKCLRDSELTNETALFIRQTVSALIYGAVIIPLLGGVKFTFGLFRVENVTALLTVAAAALCATVSYLFYYLAIEKTGASKAMALNITYTAWAVIFSLILLRDTSMLNPMTLGLACAVVVFGILAAADAEALLKKGKS